MNEQQYPNQGQPGAVPPPQQPPQQPMPPQGAPYMYYAPPGPYGPYGPPPQKPRKSWGRRTIAGIAVLGIAGAAALGGGIIEHYADSQSSSSVTSGGSSGQSPTGGSGGGPQGNRWFYNVPGQQGESGGGSQGQSEATAKQQTGIVTINTVVDYGTARAAGSGIVLTSDGQILTNHHVIEGSTAVTVTDESTGKTYQAEVVGSDSTHDIALLQLKDASGLQTAKLDDDDNLKVGDDVTAVGNSQGGGELMAAAGNVTGLGKTITASGEGSAPETLQNLIETDADVVSGDSGGALLDGEGEVVGVTTAASSGQNPDGYAIRIADALKVVDQIRSGNETGSVSIGPSAFLGVQVGTASNGATGSTGGGAAIAGTVENSPAAKAGLAAGDTITSVDGTAISSPTALTTALQKYQPGDKVRITWTTSTGLTRSATVTLVDGPAK